MTTISFRGRRIAIATCLCCFLASAGCGQRGGEKSLPLPDAVPYVTAKEFSERVTSARLPLLIEFSVPVGCYRCDEMRQQIDTLAESREGQVEAYRINLNYERSLTKELGINVCPTYVIFNAGKEVFRTSYPTSDDMLATQLDGLSGAP